MAMQHVISINCIFKANGLSFATVLLYIFFLLDVRFDTNSINSIGIYQTIEKVMLVHVQLVLDRLHRLFVSKLQLFIEKKNNHNIMCSTIK